MDVPYQFDVTHKSGLVDRLTVTADSLRAAWWVAQRLTGAGTVWTAKVRSPEALRDDGWHSLDKARKLEHIARTVT